ncbi:MAG: 4-hydroxy-tetrahydrodipicolinate synthase [Lachnospiraceae bacterium]|nr:4-hydroxy-tetrahydrodipicolinate synthase [Lachnospiraceae bacterium]MBR5733553.1 4-hydroxy-tetrahydrodipicolinate synthase [Lachnospiraceae bacterium]
MKKTIFTGAAVAIITPMNADGSVNYEEFGRLVDYQIENGTDAIVVCGTTGEASTLSHEEHVDCIKFVVKHVNKRVPVIAGTGSNCTETAIWLSQQAEAAGADAVLLVSPYYNKATQKGLIRHFGETAKSINIPVILYNIPGRTGVNIEPKTVQYLVENYENIVAVKDATGNIGWTAQTAMLCGDKLDIYSGDDNAIVPILSYGGKGVISVLSHVAPRDTHLIVEKFLNGDTKGALELQLKYLPLVNLLFSEVNPIPVKTACKLLGFAAGPMRLPLTDMEPEHAELLAAEMRRLGIIK